MIPYPATSEEVYLSPLATATLVGRRKELASIEEALRDQPHRWIVYITGEGGIGKTRLLQHILQNPPSGVTLLVARRPVDMYHTVNHTVEGLLQSLQETLTSDGQFERYLEERAKWRRIPIEEVAKRQAQRGRMIEAFLEDWNELARKTRILIGLDTVERLFLQDPVAQRLGIPTETALVYDWLLKEFLPRIQNTVVILAGRPVPMPGNGLKGVEKFLPVSLSGLTEEETLEYFQAVISLLQESIAPRDRMVAERLSLWDDELRRMVFYSLRDDGTVRPIFLALAIDYLAIAGEPFPMGRSLKEVQALTLSERRDRQAMLLKGIEERIRTDLHPTERVVEALGWLHRGAVPDLLRRITELSEEELNSACERAQYLSFVKTRPTDERLFLHDEMYALLHDPRGAIPEKIFRAVRGYYGERIDQIKEEIQNLQSQDQPIERIASEAARLRETLVEDLHYWLHRNPRDGFDRYFIYAEGALAVGDPTLDMQLRAELLDFWREHDPGGKADKIGNLPRSLVWADAAIRWTKRRIGAGEYDEALSLIQRLRGNDRDLLQADDPLIPVELDLAEATVHLYQGKLDQAKELLSQIEQTLEKIQDSPGIAVRLKAAWARLYNHWGYLRRVQGQFIAAADAYWKALPYWRAANMEAEQANTLTNLAFVLALRGRFDAARRQAIDALYLRRRLGLVGAIALTLNTLAQINLYAGEYREAENWAKQALAVAQQAGFRRGEGLAHLSLASTYRYMSEPPCPPALRKEYLETSLEHSRQAQGIFKQVSEPERLGQAYYEEGIAHREFCRPPLIQGIDVEEHARKTEKSFRKAMKIAFQHGFWALYLDAGMGLAWFYYYQKNEDALDRHLNYIEQFIQKRFLSYQITPAARPEVKDDSILDVFAQMARLHVLRGVRLMDGFDPARERGKTPPYPSLRGATREFALALEYNTLVAEEFRDLRRALNLIHERLKVLNVSELKAVYETVAEMATQFPWKPQKEQWRLWRELEDHFGPYDGLQRVA